MRLSVCLKQGYVAIIEPVTAMTTSQFLMFYNYRKARVTSYCGTNLLCEPPHFISLFSAGMSPIESKTMPQKATCLLFFAFRARHSTILQFIPKISESKQTKICFHQLLEVLNFTKARYIDGARRIFGIDKTYVKQCGENSRRKHSIS
jgi:hypothetical protein